MTGAWDEIRARSMKGEPVTMDDIVAAIATGSPPPDMGRVEFPEARRGPGRPRKWNARDVQIVRNLCHRVRFWSEVETATGDGYCTPLSWTEIYRRVGPLLSLPMEGKSLDNLLRRYPDPRDGMRIYGDEEFRRVLKPGVF